MRDTLVLCFIANPLAFCQLYHPLGLCQLYPFTMRVLWDLDTFNHVPSGACFLSILVVSFHMNLECTSFYPFGPQRKSESLIFTDFRFAHLMIYAFRSPINCSKRVSGEQKPLNNTCNYIPGARSATYCSPLRSLEELFSKMGAGFVPKLA